MPNAHLLLLATTDASLVNQILFASALGVLSLSDCRLRCRKKTLTQTSLDAFKTLHSLSSERWRGYWLTQMALPRIHSDHYEFEMMS
jgi:hypothetical protein